MDRETALNGMMKEYDDATTQLITIAFDEMESKQYEEATKHFDQIYLTDSSNYMAYYYRAFCKSHCGKRGNVYSDAQTLTAAFKLTCQKAAADEAHFAGNMLIVLKSYGQAMYLLYMNAVDSGYEIREMKSKAVEEIAKAYTEKLKSDPELSTYFADLFKELEKDDKLKYGALASIFDPAHEAVYKAEYAAAQRKEKIGKIVKWSIIGGIFLAIAIAIIVAAV